MRRTRSIRASSRRRGFSLLELLIAIGLLSVLVGMVYAFTVTLFDREARALDAAAQSQTATMIFDRLESDLMTAIASGRGGAGLRGEADSLTVTQRSVMPGSRAAPASDEQTTTIRFDERLRRVTIERTDGDAGGRETATDPAPYPVPVRMAKFRYFDGDAWRDRFSSDRGMPVAVELAIWFGDADEEPREADLLDAEAAMPDDGGLPMADEFGVPLDPATLTPEEMARLTGFGDDDEDGFDPFADGVVEDLPQPDGVGVITIPDARVPRIVRRELEMGGAP